MKYAVIQISNGNFSIVSEWGTMEKAIVNFHSVCTSLWNAQDVNTGCAVVVDEKMNIYKREFVKYQEEQIVFPSIN